MHSFDVLNQAGSWQWYVPLWRYILYTRARVIGVNNYAKHVNTKYGKYFFLCYRNPKLNESKTKNSANLPIQLSLYDIFMGNRNFANENFVIAAKNIYMYVYRKPFFMYLGAFKKDFLLNIWFVFFVKVFNLSIPSSLSFRLIT